VLESARYLDFAHGQLYTVTHAASRPQRGAVLLCGPFGVERERAYLTLVQWARMLAARGFDVLRFDYRGTGESSGNFEDMTLAHWREDAACCAAQLSATTRGGAVIVHGVRLGALLAAELFDSGIGDGLLLWAPPQSAEALLRDTLRHNLIAQRMADPHAPPIVRETLVAALEAGEPVQVDGYCWTRALWNEARQHALRLPAPGETRPWRALQARVGGVTALEARPPSGAQSLKNATVVEADTFWGSSSSLLVPRSEGFFHASLDWLDQHEPWQRSRA
jgi:alpha/beta superfamily hydrolase